MDEASLHGIYQHLLNRLLERLYRELSPAHYCQTEQALQYAFTYFVSFDCEPDSLTMDHLQSFALTKHLSGCQPGTLWIYLDRLQAGFFELEGHPLAAALTEDDVLEWVATWESQGLSCGSKKERRPDLPVVARRPVAEMKALLDRARIR